MASGRFDTGRTAFAKGEINWKSSGGDTIRCCLLKSAYTPNLSGHNFFSDLGANVVGHSGGFERTSCPQLTLGDPVAGACDAADVTFNSLPVEAGVCSYLCLFKDAGTDETSTLLVLLDSTSVVGLPYTPLGTSMMVRWDSGANKIFRL